MTDDAHLTVSAVVTDVFEKLLASVHRGELVPGERLNDVKLAEQFGVSRTPVREALQRLREIGVVEASASRFTRIAEVSPRQTAQAFDVWLSLFGVLLDEIVPVAAAKVAKRAAADHDLFLATLVEANPLKVATANFMFFNRLASESDNTSLQRAINSVVHVIRLGSQHLPHYIDLSTLAHAQSLVVSALRTNDPATSREAIAELQRIEVPLE